MENEKNKKSISDEELGDVTGGGILDKLTTGTQVNSSKDDPDGYQISERLRVLIRPGDTAE